MEIPASLRRLFVAHFGVNLLIGAPLVLVPEAFLRTLGWHTVDGSVARFGGAALLAVGVQSLLTRNGGPGTVRMMLNFKLLWSWSIIAGLIFAAADNAPDPVWVFLAFVLAMSSVWFHYRVQLDGPEADEVEDDDQDLLPAGGDELSELLHLDKATGDAEKVHPGTSFDSVAEEDIQALFASKAAEEAAKQAKAKEAAAAAQAESEAAAEEEAPAPNKTMQGLSPAKRAEMDELDALLAASASTGIDDKKAERLADLLAARKSARENGEPPPDESPDESPAEPPAEPPAESGEESMGGDDLAAMLANGPEEKTLGSDDIAAMLAGGEDEEAVGGDDIAAMLAAQDAPADQVEPPVESVAEEKVGGDDIAAMLADETAPAEKTLGQDDIAALLAGDEDGMSSEDLALMLAGNEGGSPEPAPAPPTLRGRASMMREEELEEGDEGLLMIAEDTPPPDPAEAVHADTLTESPGDTVDEAADEDAIAALLAASRGET